MGVYDDPGVRVDSAPEAEAILAEEDLARGHAACQLQALPCRVRAGVYMPGEGACRLRHAFLVIQQIPVMLPRGHLHSSRMTPAQGTSTGPPNVEIVMAVVPGHGPCPFWSGQGI